jgi:hypothetical protein
VASQDYLRGCTGESECLPAYVASTSRWRSRTSSNVGVIGEDLAAVKGVGTDGSRPPVPKQMLIAAMMVLGGLDRLTAGGLSKQARLDGQLVVDTFQNPTQAYGLRPLSSGHSKPQQLNRPDPPSLNDPNDARRDLASIRSKYRRSGSLRLKRSSGPCLDAV